MAFQSRPTTNRLSPVSAGGTRNATRERAPRGSHSINTKVVGVNPRGTPDVDKVGEHRQKVLEYIQDAGVTAFDGTPPDYWLKLEAEPLNAYDTDAVKVVLYSRVSLERGKREGVHVGYVSNGERICTNSTCKLEYERPHTADQAVLVCTACGSPTKRDGLASQLKNYATEASRSIEDYYNVTIAWEAGGVTGGGSRTHGCNIRIQTRS